MAELSSIRPLVLTLALDSVSFATFDTLRKQHFPPERNWLPAHLTLFHSLPGGEEAEVASVVEEVCRNRSSLSLTITGVRFLGRGVAYEIHSGELAALHGELTARWQNWLTPQDRQRFRPHVTIQNKVPPDDARALYEQLSSEFTPWEARGEGLLLWRYMGGPWELMRNAPFQAEPLSC